jgi:hypothetical protein
MKAEDVYQSKYLVTDPLMLFNILLSSILFCFCIYCWIESKPDKMILMGFFWLFTLGRVYASLNSYRRILLYTDKLTISGIMANSYAEIYFDTIEHIGYLRRGC